ncbi:MAG: acyl-CoA dehydrogenase, partial [Sphingopyxis sp.]
MRADLNSALTAAQAYRATAQAALTDRLAANPIDREQRAAHGFAWVATTVAALEATLDWCESGQDANPLDARIATLAFAENIGQLTGGLPMGQNEIFRPADLGLTAAARTLTEACTDLLDADHAATRATPPPLAVGEP